MNTPELEQAYLCALMHKHFKVGPLENVQNRLHRFNTKILCLPEADRPQLLSDSRMDARVGHLSEELEEVVLGHAEKNLLEVADGFMDIAFIALAALDEMGINISRVFDEVDRANMAKVNGVVAKRGHAHDAVKPEGWIPPNIHKAVYGE